MSKLHFKIQVASENGVIVYCKGAPILACNQAIVELSKRLKQSNIKGLENVIPAFDSVLVVYDINTTDHYHVQHDIKDCYLTLLAQHNLDSVVKQPQKVIDIPVFYGAPQDNDIARVAEHNGLSVSEVIKIHSQSEYRVFSIGFAPGFAFMGELDKRIAMPRLDTPRKAVPKGAVAIADRQTAIYPNTSPGGWNIIGLCPISLFNPNHQPACHFAVGDQVRFHAIDANEYQILSDD
jgi:KipI family sensor histidine kinase inhibitor